MSSFSLPGCTLGDHSTLFVIRLIKKHLKKRIDLNKGFLTKEYCKINKKQHTGAIIFGNHYLRREQFRNIDK